MLKLYGIVNCNTVKSARAWLEARHVPYEFVDFKKAPPTREQVTHWCDVLGANVVLNRKGTTWRKLDPNSQARANTEAGTVAVLVENPSAIKRPVIDTGTELLIGFDARAYHQRLIG